MRFLKSNFTVVAPLILHIGNLRIPSSWKSATLTPLYKDGDKTDRANYRPISILPVIGKVLEHIGHKQVYQSLSDNKILSDAQFRFRKGYSMSTCVLNLIYNIFNNMENGMMTGVLFLHLKKPFDTVDHKISIYGLGPLCLNWFEEYLSQRIQMTKVNIFYRILVLSNVESLRAPFWVR